MLTGIDVAFWAALGYLLGAGTVLLSVAAYAYHARPVRRYLIPPRPVIRCPYHELQSLAPRGARLG